MAYEALGSAFPVVAAALVLIGNFLPAGAVGLGMTLDRQRRSTQDFTVNMLNDLNWFLDWGGSNERLVTEISKFMSVKYDWLENYCLVYDDVRGSDKHWIGGYRVNSLHRNGKCGIVFYRWKAETPRFSSVSNKAYEVVRKVECSFSGWFSYVADAKVCYNKIMPKITEANIQWSGFVVFSGSGPNLKIKGTFSTSVVDVDKIIEYFGYNTIARHTTARAILLLK